MYLAFGKLSFYSDKASAYEKIREEDEDMLA